MIFGPTTAFTSVVVGFFLIKTRKSIMYLEPASHVRRVWKLRNEDHSQVKYEREGVSCTVLILVKKNTDDVVSLLAQLRASLQRKLSDVNLNINEDVRVNLPEGTFKFPIHNGRVYSPDRMN